MSEIKSFSLFQEYLKTCTYDWLYWNFVHNTQSRQVLFNEIEYCLNIHFSFFTENVENNFISTTCPNPLKAFTFFWNRCEHEVKLETKYVTLFQFYFLYTYFINPTNSTNNGFYTEMYMGRRCLFCTSLTVVNLITFFTVAGFLKTHLTPPNPFLKSENLIRKSVFYFRYHRYERTSGTDWPDSTWS